MKLRWLLSLVAILCAALPWALVDAQPVPPVPPVPVPAPGPAPAPVPAVEGEAAAVSTVRLGVTTGWTLDPHRAREAESFRLAAALYDTLYTYEAKAAPAIRPLLAEAMPTVSEDGLTWTIKLRKDVRFHNNAAAFGQERTRTLRAQDVVDSLKRLAIAGPDRSMYWMIGGMVVGLDEYGAEGRDNLQYGADDIAVEGVSATDEHTVVLKLTRPFGALLTVLAHPCTSVVPREAMDAYGEALGQRAVGSGPYRLHAVAPGRLVVLKRFEGYWGEKPAFERVMLEVAESDQLLFANFTAGRIARAPIDDQTGLEFLMPGGKPGPVLQQAGVEPLWTDDSSMFYMAFNMDDPVWGALDDDGRALRKAVSLALDRASVAKDAGYNAPWSGNAFTSMPRGTEFDDLALEHSLGDTDAKAAKDVLDASKYKGGKDPATGDALVFEVVLQSGSLHQALGKNLKKSLQPLGITVVTRVVRGDYRRVVRTDTAQGFFSGWFLDSPDTQNFLQLFYGANAATETEFNNNARYRSEEFDKHYKQFEALLPTPANAAKRRELVAAMAKLIAKDRPMAPLFFVRHAELRGKSVQWPELPRVTFLDLRHLKPAKTE